MKTKHIFLPIYALLMILAIMVVWYKPITDKLTLIAAIFLTANLSYLLIPILLRMEINWNRKLKDFI